MNLSSVFPLVPTPCHHRPKITNSFDIDSLGAILIFGVAEVINHCTIVLEHNTDLVDIFCFLY